MKSSLTFLRIDQKHIHYIHLIHPLVGKRSRRGRSVTGISCGCGGGSVRWRQLLQVLSD